MAYERLRNSGLTQGFTDLLADPMNVPTGQYCPPFDWNGGRLQLESLAGIVGIRSLQEQVANRRKRRGSKARVVSVTEKASERRQVGDRKANTSELPFKCRKCSDDVETGG